MAWQSNNYFWTVSDEIRYWYRNRDVLFFGAAGTSGCAPHGQHGNVLFPAQMDEVIAVTGLNSATYTLDCSVHRGPEVELVAFISQPTTGRYTPDVINRSSAE